MGWAAGGLALVGLGLSLGVVALLWPEGEAPVAQPEELGALEAEIQRYEDRWGEVEGSAQDRVGRARALMDSRQGLVEAEGALQQALVLEPGDEEALALLVELSGVSEGSLGLDPALARELAQDLPSRERRDHALAALALGAQDPVEALRLHRSVPLDGIGARRLRMEIQLALGNLDRALEQAEQVEAVFPADAGACRVRGAAQLAEGRPALAEVTLEACLARRSDRGLLRELAELADRTGRWERAVELFERAGDQPAALTIRWQQDGPVSGDTLSRGGSSEQLLLGWIALAEQDPERALELVKGTPNNGEVRAAALLSLGQREDAAQLLTSDDSPAALVLAGRAGLGWARAVQADPGNPHLWRQYMAESPREAARDLLASWQPAELLLRESPWPREHWDVVAPARWAAALDAAPPEALPSLLLMAGRPPEGGSPELLAAADLLQGDPQAALRRGATGPVQGLALLAAGRTAQAHGLAVDHRGDPLWGAVLALATAARGNDGAAMSLLSLSLRARPAWTALESVRYEVDLRALGEH